MTATDPTPAVTGVPFTMNGQELIAEEGELLIEACERNGVHIPRFCYHKRMDPVGMCRMCLVEVDTGRGPALQPSCMLPVTPEMKVETESQATKEAQDGVLELLLANHPLDCPVCDKGGECPLQDNAYAYGPGESRFVEEKRHFEKPIPISDLVHLDRERCILCDRCTRFASDVAGDALIHFIDRGSSTQVNTFPDHPFASYFSGNTVQICPVGALTASPYRFKARPWDLAANMSTSIVDGTGSRVLLQSSQDKLIRVLGVDADAVNWGWLGDKERFIYEANYSENRITEPLVNSAPSRWNDAISTARTLLEQPDVAVIGGNRLTFEAQYMWRKTLDAYGIADVDASMGDEVPFGLSVTVPRATYDEAFAVGSQVLFIGEDLKETMPALFLRLRDAVVRGHVDLFETTYRQTALSGDAKSSIRPLPGQLAASVEGLFAPDRRSDSTQIDPDKPLTVIVGRPNIAESPSFLGAAISKVRVARPEAKFIVASRRGNSVGAIANGLAPSFTSASGESGDLDVQSRTTEAILEAAKNGEVHTLVLLGADPIGDFPDKELAEAALGNVDNIVAVDCFQNESSSLASVFLPVTMFGETNGTFINAEGRASVLQARVTAPGLARSDFDIAVSLAPKGAELPKTIEDVHTEVDLPWAQIELDPEGVVIDSVGLMAESRNNREPAIRVISDPEPPQLSEDELVLVCGHKLWDTGTMLKNCDTLAGLASPMRVRAHTQDLKRLNLASASTVKLTSASGEVTVEIRPDDTIAPGTIWAPINVGNVDIRDLISCDESMTVVKVVEVSDAGVPTPKESE